MSITAKLTQDELALYEVLRHPLWNAEFMRNLDIDPETEEPWELSDYQAEMICDHASHVALCCGRAVGKSESILDKTVWYLINNFWPHDPVAIVTPNRVHLEPLFNKLRKWLQTHSLLQNYVSRNSINSQIFNIRAKNGFLLDARIAGTSGGGDNVIGLHTPVIMLDEAGVFPWGTYIELLPTLNTWQKGSQLFVSGVPTGQRERNVLYFADQEDEQFYRHNVPQHRNPRYTDADEVRNRKQFGGVESEDYIHLVLGRHGTPVYSLFDRTKMLIQTYDVFVSKIYGPKVKESPGMFMDVLRMAPMPPVGAQKVVIGVDLGYTEPSVIVVLYMKNNVWRILARIVMYQVPYNKQQDFLAKLSDKYDPGFMAIDAGGAGKAVIQNLLNDNRYRKHRLSNKIISVDFQASLGVGYDEAGEELKSKAKEYAMNRLQEYAHNHWICFSGADDDVITELERTVYSRTPSGNLVYKTMTERGGKYGDDHNLAALLSFMVGQYYVEEIGQFKRHKGKLRSPQWMI